MLTHLISPHVAKKTLAELFKASSAAGTQSPTFLTWPRIFFDEEFDRTYMLGLYDGVGFESVATN